MQLKEMVAQNRTRRRFDESKPLSVADLVELVDLARLTPSAMNMQPLKYVVTADKAQCDAIFPLLGWAGYLKDWKGPEEGERPTGYIVVMLDKDLAKSPNCDHGIASQTIMLGAVEKGLGGCMIATVNRKKLAEIFDLDEERFEVLLVLALGVPSEEVVVEPVDEDGNIKYWHDEQGAHHLPKRSLQDLLVAVHPAEGETDSF